MNRNPKHIELFAGCGGLCLGLEAEGLDLLFANELSPMAAETFAFNILHENLRLTADAGTASSNVYWLDSQHPSDQLDKRLRENPQQVTRRRPHQDPIEDIESLYRKMIVGDIQKLNLFLKENQKLALQLRNLDLDLVSGGPPCQSFSMAGLRDHKNKRNQLPAEFAKFVHHVKPKIAVLENVSGILRPFTVKVGKGTRKLFSWFEVAKSFAQRGYVPICIHANAKYTGAAQNRPRFLMFAIRNDVFPEIEAKLPKRIAESSLRFYAEIHDNNWKLPEESPLQYWDVEKEPVLFASGAFKPLKQYGLDRENLAPIHTVEEAINDLRSKPNETVNTRYVALLRSTFPVPNLHPGRNQLPNHVQRTNSTKVKKRFRLYQILSAIRETDPCIATKIANWLNSTDELLTESCRNNLLTYKFLIDDETGNGKLRRLKPREIDSYLAELKTKKQTQRALLANQPAPAALSIPDDACHYGESLEDIRTLSVREMARFQSFPDWFEFRSKITTGGQMRRFEVPQYTQVGNAVPPLLGKAIGQVVNYLLDP